MNILNSPKLETAQVFFSGWMIFKQIPMGPCNRNYSAIEGEVLSIPVTTWMNLKDIMTNEKAGLQGSYLTFST